MRTIYPSASNESEVIKELNRLHEEYVLAPADKACNNIFVSKIHHYQCIINGLDFNSTIDNHTYTQTNFFQIWNSSKPCIRFRYF
jgi:hypothetical protein